MEGNGTTVRIVRVGEVTPAQFTVMGWEVKGIGEVVERLVAAGVEMERYGLPGQREDGVWRLRVGRRWRGSKIQMGMCLRFRSMGEGVG